MSIKKVLIDDEVKEEEKNIFKIFYDFQYNNSLSKLIAASAINKILLNISTDTKWSGFSLIL